MFLSYTKLVLRQATQNETKQIFQKKNNKLKNPNLREADKLTISKRDRGVKLVSSEKQLHLVFNSALKVRHRNQNKRSAFFSSADFLAHPRCKVT